MKSFLLLCVTLGACAASPHVANAPTAAPATTSDSGDAEIELVESAPTETTLDHADVRNASEVWPELIDRAKRTVDIGAFYASEADGAAAKTSRLAPVFAAVARAVARGVRVRMVEDASFAAKYPETLDALRRAGVAVRTIDCAKRYGGVQHAKYMVIDGEESYVGSQNFDWRSLEHIQEMGVRVRSAAVAGALADVFETDWALADAATSNDARVHARASADGKEGKVTTRTGEVVTFWASPKGWLPDESRWDLTELVELLDRARVSVDLQVLTYSTAAPLAR